MNCRQARIDLALCVGEDLPEAARRESLRQHVAQCPGCRAHYKRLRGMLRVLEATDRDRTFDVGDSLWPQLSNRIRRLEESPAPSSRFNGWLPFVAVTAACAMLVVVMDVRAPSSPTQEAVARDMFSTTSWFRGLPTENDDRNIFGPQYHQSRELHDLEPSQGFSTERTRLEAAQQPMATPHD